MTLEVSLLLILSFLLMVSGLLLFRKLKRLGTRYHMEQAAIADFATGMLGKHSEDEVLWSIVRNCITQLDFEEAVVYQFDKQKAELVQVAALGPKCPDGITLKNAINIPLGKGIVGFTAMTGKAEIIRDTRKDKRYIWDEGDYRSEISVPIVYEGELIGVIDSEHSRVGFFNEQHLRVLKVIASLCAVKISKLRRLEESRVYSARIHSILNLVPDFLILSSPDGKRKFVNDTYSRFTGVSREELMLQNPLAEASMEERMDYARKLKLLTPSNPTSSGVRYDTGEGGKFQWTHWSETALFDESGNITEILSMGHNVSALRDAQSLRDNYIETLENILQKTSHEVRQPVAQLLGVADLLAHPQERVNIDELMGYIRTSAAKLDKATRELNDYIHDKTLI